LNNTEKEAIKYLRSNSSNTRASKQENIATSPLSRALARFKLEQNGTSITLQSVETQHDRDLIRHFLEETGVRNYRVFDIPESNESVIQLNNFEDCEHLIDMFRVHGVSRIQIDYSLLPLQQALSLSLSKHAASPGPKFMESGGNQHVWSVLRCAEARGNLETKT
jgi:hypothetical protein